MSTFLHLACLGGLTLFTCMPSFSQTEENPTGIKTIISSSVELPAELTLSKSALSEQEYTKEEAVEYNAAGQKIKYQEFGDYNFLETTTYTYNTAGLLEKEVYVSGVGDRVEFSSSTENKYNAKGQLIAYSHSENGSNVTNSTQYFQRGVLRRTYTYILSAGNPVGSMLDIYDAEGRQTESFALSNGLQLPRNLMEYDFNGRLTEKIILDEYDLPDTKFTQKYDDQGNQTELGIWGFDAENFDVFAIPDFGTDAAMDDAIQRALKLAMEDEEEALPPHPLEDSYVEYERYWDEDGWFLKTRYVTVFNDRNDRIEELEFNGAGELTRKTTFEYVYNEKGDWIYRTMREAGFPNLVTQRIITY